MTQIRVLIESREHFEQLKSCDMYAGKIVERVERVEVESIRDDFDHAVIHVRDPEPIRRDYLIGDIR